MKLFKLFLVTSLLSLVLANVGFAGSKYPWSDSLNTRALSGLVGPSVQEILNNLGYSINVATDEVPLSVFAPPFGGTTAEVTLEYLESASKANFGWYPKGNTAGAVQLFAKGAAVGTKANIAGIGSDSLGFYLGPTNYSDTWYSQKSLNWDNFRHIKAFKTNVNGKYVVVWEDLADGGDQDFNDFIVEVKFADPTELKMDVTGKLNYVICVAEQVCFNLNCSGGIGDISLYLLDGNNVTLVQTGASPFNYQNCYYPYPVDSVHTFIYRLQDTNGHSLTDTVHVTIKYETNPELTIKRDLIDTTICAQSTICFNDVIATDAENDQITYLLLSGPGTIDSVTGAICFLPDNADSMDYQFVVMATDSCCRSFGIPKELLPCPRDTINVRVKIKAPPILTTIKDTTITLCKPSQVCFPVTATSNGQPVTVFKDCGSGVLSGGQLCFNPPTAGTYQFCFHANDACGSVVRDTVTVTILLNHTPIANAGRDSTLFQCTAAPICWNASCSDVDGNLFSCDLITGPGTYDGTKICFTPTGSGTYMFVLRATDKCTEVSLDTAVINVTVGRPPVATIRDTSLTLCTTKQICMPASCSDPDGDLTKCELISPLGSYDGSNVCFTPDVSGTYQFIIRATDACGSLAYDTANAVVNINRAPQINPFTGSYTLCDPDSICIPINATDPDGGALTYTTTMGVIKGNNVCLYSGPAGRRQFTLNVTATDACGASASALFTINVVVNMVPVISVPTLTKQTLCTPTQLCFNVTTVDTVITKLIYSLLSGPGSVDATGKVCFTPTADGTFNWQVLVKDSCGKADTGAVSWQVDFVDKPTAAVFPADADTVMCTGVQMGSVCIPFTYSASETGITMGVSSTNAGISPILSYSGGNGQICFTPLLNQNTIYKFTLNRVNSCKDTTKAVYNYAVTYDKCDSSCIVVSLEKTLCYTLGSEIEVRVSFDAIKLPVGGYDFLIKYDESAFSFLSARLGTAISGWEYFTYRFGASGNCSGSCPGGLIKIISIADANNGAAHPPVSQFKPTGVVAFLKFRVTSNSSFAGLSYPLSFFWYDCGDNSVSSVTGDTLFIDKMVIDPEHVLWDEFDEVGYPEANRYDHVGAPDTCMVGSKSAPIRCVEFRNGLICIISNDSIDARGDINMNGQANEIADAVLYTNYFLRGISVFHISVAGQIAASDINNDGHTLTVGDLIYLLRIITGDALPIPKLAPFASASATFTIEKGDGGSTLWSESGADIGGVFIRLNTHGRDMIDIAKEMGLSNLTMKYELDGDIANIIAYSEVRGAVIPHGKNELMTISGDVDIEHVEACDYNGSMLSANLNKSALPDQFELSQNYPNPFNPTTSISILLPRPSDYSLTIMNINGQIVREFKGAAGAGTTTVTWDAKNQKGIPVATGVYFYRLDASGFSDTKKMLLMK